MVLALLPMVKLVEVAEGVLEPSDHLGSPGFRIRIFFCGSGSGSWGYSGEGAGGKGKNDFFWVFFHVSDDSNNGCLKSEQKKWNCLHYTSPTLQNNDLFIHFLTFLPGSGSANLCGSGSGQGENMRIRADPDPKPCLKPDIFSSHYCRELRSRVSGQFS